jgi:hypothetical protein
MTSDSIYVPKGPGKTNKVAKAVALVLLTNSVAHTVQGSVAMAENLYRGGATSSPATAGKSISKVGGMDANGVAAQYNGTPGSKDPKFSES